MVYPPTSEPTISLSSPVTASLLPPIPTPTYGDSGHFSILCMTRITAPPAAVLAIIRDTSSWPEWNSFTPHCRITSSPNTDGSSSTNLLEAGTRATLDIFLSGDGLVKGRRRSRVQAVLVTCMESLEDCAGFRIAWKAVGTMDWHWQYYSERVLELKESEEGGTEFRCWETFGGVSSLMIKPTVGGLLCERFGDFARDLKVFFEGRRDSGSESWGKNSKKERGHKRASGSRSKSRRGKESIEIETRMKENEKDQRRMSL